MFCINEERFEKIRNILLDLNITANCDLDEAIVFDDEEAYDVVDNAMERLYDVMDAVDKAKDAFNKMDMLFAMREE